MKIIFFSDAHGNRYAVDEFFNQMEDMDYDLAVYGGDSLGYYYESDYIISSLRERHIKCLLGNHDKMFLDLIDDRIEENKLVEKYGNSYKQINRYISKDNAAYLRTLKSRFDMETDNLRIVFTHGSAENNLEGRVYPDTNIPNESLYDGIDYFFFGHTHHKMVRPLQNGCVLINPGSVGQQRDGKGCSFAVFDTTGRTIDYHIVKYDVNKLIDDIKCRESSGDMKRKLIEVLLRKTED